MLLEFVISCLLDQPNDVVDYAAGYFTSLQDHRHTVIVHDYENESNDIKEENGGGMNPAIEVVTSEEITKKSSEKVRETADCIFG